MNRRHCLPLLLAGATAACNRPQSEVAFAMWAGDERRNSLFRNEIAAHLRRRLGLSLRIVPLADTAEAVNKLLNEKAAGKSTGGSIDLLWINGENFRTARQGGVLHGPFAAALPNLALYPRQSCERDFGTPIDGFEAPWLKAQFVLAFDTARFPAPPRSLPALDAWIQTHPGRFTYIAPPDFTGSAFIRHLLLAAGNRHPAFWTGFDESLYRQASALALAQLRRWKPLLWRRGATYPPSLKELNRLFANNEVDFAMSYSPAFASVAIAHGEFPASARTFVLDEGTLGNYSYLAVPFNAANPAAAESTVNELMSFEVAILLATGLDELIPHRVDALSAPDRARAEALPRGPATLAAAELEKHFLPEPDAEYLTRFEKDWRSQVLQT